MLWRDLEKALRLPCINCKLLIKFNANLDGCSTMVLKVDGWMDGNLVEDLNMLNFLNYETFQCMCQLGKILNFENIEKQFS